MDFTVTEEQEMLRDSVRGFLAAKMPLTSVRQLMETDTGHDPATWMEMASLGWQGLAIPEQHGGAGYTFRELAVVLEELGRALAPGPFLSSAVLGAQALLIAGSDEQKAELLPGIASGEQLVTVATVESSGSWDPRAITTSATVDGTEVVIDGEKCFVLDGHIADTLVVSARSGDGAVDLFLVDASRPGVTSERLDTMDMTRKQARLELSGVRVPEGSRLGAPGSGVRTLEALMDRAAAALAHEQVGAADRCLEMSVAYAKERHQFGRAIGSFQAVKHMCADMLVELESARSAARNASGALAEGDLAEASIACPLAKSCCSDAFFAIAADTIQVHGGIGFTWEHDAHLYFKRAKTDELLFGDPSLWRAKLADRLGL